MPFVLISSAASGAGLPFARRVQLGPMGRRLGTVGAHGHAA